MLLLSVDPGVRACGCALFFEERLVAAKLVVNPVARGQDVASAAMMAEVVESWASATASALRVSSFTKHVVIECPTVRKAGDQKGDQNTSIVPLTLVVGAIAGRLYLDWTAFQYFPRDWKGTVNPDVFIAERIIPMLSGVERERVKLPSAESLQHNVWDGVGVGLKYLGRLEPRRIFHKE